jgi:hypothetical protein
MPETKEQVDLAEVVNSQATRIAELEYELSSYKRQVDYLQTGRPNWIGGEWYWRIAYLEGKIRRQAEAIRNIQKVGWQPTRIIKEELLSSDEPEPRHDSHRREKRRPSVLIIEGV